VDEERKRTWDVSLAIVSPIITVIGLLIGVWQFNRGEENKVRLEYELIQKKDRVDFRRKIWLEQLATYHTIADTAGKIASSTGDKKKLEGLTKDFTTAYWGLAIFVEDRQVQQAMIAFNLAIHDYETGWLDANGLKRKAERLVSACRHSVSTGSVE
jgi:hypothetical protein